VALSYKVATRRDNSVSAKTQRLVVICTDQIAPSKGRRGLLWLLEMNCRL
jgi:hypothetical protein